MNPAKHWKLILLATLLAVGGHIGIAGVTSLLGSPSQATSLEEFNKNKVAKSNEGVTKDSQRISTIESDIHTLRREIGDLLELNAALMHKMVSIEESDSAGEVAGPDEDTPNPRASEEELEYRRAEATRNILAVMTETIEAESLDTGMGLEVEASLMNAIDAGELDGIEASSATCVSSMCRVNLHFDDDAQVDPGDVLSKIPFEGHSFATGNEQEATLFIARDGGRLPKPQGF